jgi:hypothetical protein
VNDLAGQVAPWLAIVASCLTVLGVAARVASGSRLRSRLADDAALVQQLPDGAAKGAMMEVLTHDATRLRDRTIHGFRPGLAVTAALYGAVLILIGAASFGLGLLTEQTTGEPPELFGSESLSKNTAKLSMSLGIALAVFAGAFSVLAWFFRQMERLAPNTSGRVLRRLRRLLSERAQNRSRTS